VRRGRCDHCGAGPLRYGVEFLHVPSNTVIAVGVKCAGRLALSSRTELEIRKLAEDRRRVMKRDAWRKADPRNEAAYDFLFTRLENGDYGFGGFYHSLMHKLNRYGGLTENQLAAIEKSINRQAEFEARKAEEPQPETPLAEGKREVEGVIVSTKVQEGYMPGESVVKMLVKQDDLNKVWGTVPQALFAAVYQLKPQADDEEWTPGMKLLVGCRV
jgi:hypothetical protein